VRDGLKTAVQEARRIAERANELPIAAYVTPCYDASVPIPIKCSFTDHDSRQSVHHPLRHVCLNIIRKVACAQAIVPSPPTTSVDSPLPRSLIPALALTPAYLLTSYTLFITHEPCIMCSMALLHSRVKMIFYVFPMPRTGGCGGLVKESVPGLEGVNHRFGIWRWKGELDELGMVEGALDIDGGLDVQRSET